MNDETNKSTDEKNPNPSKSKSSGDSKKETPADKQSAAKQGASADKELSEMKQPSADKASAEKQSQTKKEPDVEKEITVEQAQEPKRKADHARVQTSTKTKKGGRFIWVLVVLLIGFMGVSGGLGYFTYNGWLKAEQSNAAQLEKLAGLEESISGLQATNQRLQKSLNAEKQSSSKTQRSLESRIQVAEKRIIAQNKRLQSMSSTSRDDWLLAEAEYLLKLANQRVLIEREGESAVGLLSEADAILRDMIDPDLFPLRKAISQDLAALRLSQSIDVEGIYLALLALAQQVDALPTRPKPSFSGEGDDGEALASAEPGFSEKPWWAVPEASFKRFIAAFRNQINVISHDEGARPVVLMQPETHLYLQQNLRLQLERAQLAMLREQQKIYSESLSQAAFWVRTYFPETEQSQVFIGELQKLGAEMVVKQLPDISGSWELLNTYIQDLHDLKGGEAPPAVEVKPETNKQQTQQKQGGE